MKAILIGLIVFYCVALAISLVGVFFAGAMAWLFPMVLSPIGIAVALLGLEQIKEQSK